MLRKLTCQHFGIGFDTLGRRDSEESPQITGSRWWERAASRCRQALQTYPGMGIVPAGFFIHAVATGGDPATRELAEIFDNSDRLAWQFSIREPA